MEAPNKEQIRDIIANQDQLDGGAVSVQCKSGTRGSDRYKAECSCKSECGFFVDFKFNMDREIFECVDYNPRNVNTCTKFAFSKTGRKNPLRTKQLASALVKTMYKLTDHEQKSTKRLFKDNVTCLPHVTTNRQLQAAKEVAKTILMGDIYDNIQKLTAIQEKLEEEGTVLTIYTDTGAEVAAKITEYYRERWSAWRRATKKGQDHVAVLSMRTAGPTARTSHISRTQPGVCLWVGPHSRLGSKCGS